VSVQAHRVGGCAPRNSNTAGQMAVAVVAFPLLQGVPLKDVFDFQGDAQRWSLGPQVLNDPVGPVGLALDESTRLAHCAETCLLGLVFVKAFGFFHVVAHAAPLSREHHSSF